MGSGRGGWGVFAGNSMAPPACPEIISGPPRVVSGPPRVVSGPPRVVSGPPRVVSGPPCVVSGLRASFPGGRALFPGGRLRLPDPRFRVADPGSSLTDGHPGTADASARRPYRGRADEKRLGFPPDDFAFRRPGLFSSLRRFPLLQKNSFYGFPLSSSQARLVNRALTAISPARLITCGPPLAPAPKRSLVLVRLRLSRRVVSPRAAW